MIEYIVCSFVSTLYVSITKGTNTNKCNKLSDPDIGMIQWPDCQADSLSLPGSPGGSNRGLSRETPAC